MKRSIRGIAACVGGVAVVVAAGCEPTNRVFPGAPQLTRMTVIGPDGNPIDLSPNEAGVPPAVPPLSTVLAVFDRLLDPSPLETIDGGVPIPNAGVATFQWAGMSISAPATYLPHGDVKVMPILYPATYGQGPSLHINPAMPPGMGLPSGSSVTLVLDAAKVRSHDKTMPFVPAAGVSPMLTFTTEPLTVTFGFPAADMPDGDAPPSTPMVPADFVLPITFNNLIASGQEALVTVVVTQNGMPVPSFEAQVGRSETGPGFVVSAPANQSWPAGASVTVTVAGTITDPFSNALGEAATASFTVAP